MVVRISDIPGKLHIPEEFLAVRFGATAADREDAAGESEFVELIDGKLILHSPVSLRHSEVFGFAHWILKGFVDARRLGTVLTGPFTMDLSADRKFEPDILFVAADHLANLRSDRLLGPADLAIEIASPSTRAYDRGEKRECYRVGGVREYWMIDPIGETVTLDRPAGQEIIQTATGVLKSEVCPGFWLRAEWLLTTSPPPAQQCLREILGA